MKKDNIIEYWLLFPCIVFMLGSLSCKKYLDAKQNSNFSTPATLQDAQGMMDESGTMLFSDFQYGEGSSDNYYMSQWAIDLYKSYGILGIGMYNWENFLTPDDLDNGWSRPYKSILYCNIALETLSGIGRTDENKAAFDNCKGSALFFRGFYFWKLLTTFAKAYNENTKATDLGIPLRLSSDFNIVSVRSSVGDSYKQAIADLTASVHLLPDHGIIQERPSRQAAYGALAEVYLSMRDYEKAGLYADSCLQLGGQLLDYNLVNVNSPAPFAVKINEVVINIQASAILFFPGYYSVDSTLYESYETDDIRKKAFFNRDTDSTLSFKGGYSLYGGLFVGVTTAEMYLVRAECNAKAGRLDDAVKDINTLLQKRYVNGTFIPYTTGSAEEVLHLVRTERRKELAFRDLRWTDIKRMNLEGANIQIRRVIGGKDIILPPNDDRYALLIPFNDIKASGMKQNPR
jgi:tetratricopeptide (TPR) repeat protein